jgi:hypothetical protein
MTGAQLKNPRSFHYEVLIKKAQSVNFGVSIKKPRSFRFRVNGFGIGLSNPRYGQVIRGKIKYFEAESNSSSRSNGSELIALKVIYAKFQKQIF